MNKSSMRRILIILEKARINRLLVQQLNKKGTHVDSTSNIYSAFEYSKFEQYDYILLSMTIPLMKINEIVKRLNNNQNFSKIVLIGESEDQLEKIYHSFNCDYYWCYNQSVENLRVYFQKRKFSQFHGLDNQSYREMIIGHSKKMNDYFSLLNKVMKSSITILIHGESGTGKELTARAIQKGGDRSDKPFVTVNCAAIPENLLETEFFGHEKGAFTGATSQRIGKFETAHEGTIFLDEIAELPPLLQAKFLRVLEEQTFERVGGNDSIQVDVRIISATNKNLKDLVKKGLFREDLYYRLNTLSIEVPPLRDRKEDIPLLVQYFLKKYLSKTGRDEKMELSGDALNALKFYDWPGNVRELENVITRAMVLSDSSVIEKKDLPVDLFMSDHEDNDKKQKTDLINRVCSLKELEKEAIKKALFENDFNASKAAKVLSIGRMTFYRKIKEYSIQYKE